MMHRKGKKNPNEKIPQTTSWGKVANWYDTYLEKNDDSYQKQVILPNLLRVLDLQSTNSVLDLACGQGFFTREFAKTASRVVGADISKELIEKAKVMSGKAVVYHATPAHKLPFAKDREFDVVTIVLAIQNIENISEVFSEVKRVLKPHGRLILVMNHPAFRIPKHSGWGFDENTSVQYRAVPRYLSGIKIPIVMHPGQIKSEETISYHRSLQDFFKIMVKQGFVASKLEEWISHKKSEKGPRQIAEDVARKEIPLFLMLEAKNTQ